MRRAIVIGLAGLAFSAAVPAARAQNFYGVHGGYARALGPASDFATDGTTLELRWRRFNRARSAFEFVVGYTELEVDGEIQNTIERFKRLVLEKNARAQTSGGPGNGFLVAEYGTFETFHIGANLLFTPWKAARTTPYFSFGGAAYNWKVPFRVRFSRVPFFGEQHSYDPVDYQSPYQGVQPNEDLDFTKHHTSGGLSAAVGGLLRLQRHVTLDAEVRAHLLLSSGQGDRELGADDQDYLDDIKFFVAKGGLHYRF